MADQVVHKSNTLGFVLAAMIGGGSFLIAKKMEQPPVIVVPPQPGPTPGPGPQPTPVIIDATDTGKETITKFVLNLADNYENAARFLRNGKSRDAVNDWLIAENIKNQNTMQPVVEALDATKDDAEKNANTFEQLSKGYQQAVSGAK